MTSSNSEILEHLDILDRLGSMNEDELVAHFTNENIAVIRLVAPELNEDLQMEHILSDKRFIAVVRDLAQMRALWKLRFEETAKAVEEASSGGKEMQAQWIIDGFLRFCPSPFYRGMAEKLMEKV
jgi:hypothetical protein